MRNGSHICKYGYYVYFIIGLTFITRFECTSQRLCNVFWLSFQQSIFHVKSFCFLQCYNRCCSFGHILPCACFIIGLTLITGFDYLVFWFKLIKQYESEIRQTRSQQMSNVVIVSLCLTNKLATFSIAFCGNRSGDSLCYIL